jgi:hypothetical protein
MRKSQVTLAALATIAAMAFGISDQAMAKTVVKSVAKPPKHATRSVTSAQPPLSEMNGAKAKRVKHARRTKRSVSRKA